MPAGRPTKYTKELLSKANDYLDGGYIGEGEEVPTHEGLSLVIDVSRATLYDWANDPEKKEFSDILDKCNRLQTKLLLGGALRGDLNGNIAKLMLGKQGYKESSQQEIGGIGGGPIKTESKVEWVVQPVKAINETDA